ncbi:hypothetical protein DOTSEDRAFT_75808 [Dothistroma septosporum NZE10]|uniref:Autophagy-related protein 14 n=1 Tax=Dothistroma septosporum (strain NZE10 / CBS 128990) TaxID=675120 RepID=N1PBI8_DOTSN|nr:hypothetical protein DOTSEDRAFT_75808 [Dothistroma septosporum NZE10]
MECGICLREYGTRRRPLCTTCVQATLYGPRMRQATALLDREKSHTHAEAIIRPGNDGVLASLPDDTDLDAITTGVKKHSYDRARAERDAADYRLTQILDHAKDLRSEMREFKRMIETRKEMLEHRRKDLATGRSELDKLRPRAMDPIASAIKKASQRLDRTRYKVVEARTLLCREAASASNFQRRRAPETSPEQGPVLQANSKSVYMLGGIALTDLRSLHARTQGAHGKTAMGGRVIEEPHDSVSESHDSVARLLNLCAHYLSVRLPAEIILPHEDFPRAMIIPEKSSYKLKNIPFPGLATSQSSSSPAASRVLNRSQTGPRPLWLDRPLAQLSKEDAKAYGRYIEGITLLAWDVAWLCKTQGIDVNTYEDACNIGRNLHLLFSSSRRAHHRPSLDRKDTAISGKSTPVQDLRMGMFSHGSAVYNLASVAGVDLMKDWKMASSARLADKLRNNLLAEISGAEWDLIEGQEWDDDPEDERPVMVGGSRRPQESKHAAMSVISVKPSDGAEDEDIGSASDAKRRGNSGWTKIRGRSDG